MNPASVLAAVRKAGVKVSERNSKLVATPATRIPAWLKPELKQHYRGILDLIANESADDGMPPAWRQSSPAQSVGRVVRETYLDDPDGEAEEIEVVVEHTVGSGDDEVSAADAAWLAATPTSELIAAAREEFAGSETRLAILDGIAPTATSAFVWSLVRRWRASRPCMTPAEFAVWADAWNKQTTEQSEKRAGKKAKAVVTITEVSDWLFGGETTND